MCCPLQVSMGLIGTGSKCRVPFFCICKQAHCLLHTHNKHGAATLEVDVPHGEYFLGLSYGLQPVELGRELGSNSQCGNTADVVLSTPHSCLTNICLPPCSHLSTVLPLTQVARGYPTYIQSTLSPIHYS